eukprot:16557-Heterococcus_DN1.PRE.4
MMWATAVASAVLCWSCMVVQGFVFAPNAFRVSRYTTACSRCWCSSSSSLHSTTQTAEQGFGGGIQLPDKEQAADYSKFLARAVQLHLDQEWLTQACHEQIGAEVANIYLSSAVERGVTDLNELIMDVGTGLESFDMGDAFVGAWDVANVVSDFMIAYMGLETAACSFKLPEGLTEAAAVSFTADEAQALSLALDGEFERYRWLGKFMEELVGWEEANRIMAISLGYRPAAEIGGALDDSAVADVWRSRGTPGAPDFSTELSVLAIAEAQLPQHPDDQEAMEDFLEVVYGEEAKKMADASTGADSEEYRRRAVVFKWLYNNDFLKSKLAVAAP